MKISSIGEFELIRRIVKEFDIDNEDAAALKFGDQYLLLTSDMIDEASDLPEPITPWQIGWHVVAVNLSDLAARGAVPAGFLLSVGIRSDIELEYLMAILKGVRDCCGRYNCPFLGGDMNQHDSLVLSGFAIGTGKDERILSRKGAKVGDVVVSTHGIGEAGLALYALKKDIIGVGVGVEAGREYEDCIKALFQPIPQIEAGIGLVGIASSCMDNSDGLARSLHILADINGVGFSIDFEELPIAAGIDRLSFSNILEMTLYSGGDYGLIATIPEGEAIPESVKEIGRVVERDEGITLNYRGDKDEKIEVENRGYRHFQE